MRLGYMHMYIVGRSLNWELVEFNVAQINS